MSGPFRGCIAEALGKGEIDAESAAVAEEAYDDAWEALSGSMGPDEADRQAADAVMARLEAEKIEARRRHQLTVRARRRIVEGIAGLKTRRGYRNVRALGGGDGSGRPPKDGWVQGGTPPEKGKPYSHGGLAAMGLKRLVENRPGLSGAPSASIEGRYRALRGEFDALMADVIERFETRTGLDQPNRAEMPNIGREAFGEETGDASAKALATAWTETAEHARQLFNGAGGSIGKIERWGFPTRHDGEAVRRAGKDAWVAATLPRLDRQGMVDRATGQPFTEARLKAVLGQTWDSIASGGASKRKPGDGLGNGSLWRSRADERFLKYRSYDDWAASQQEFGRGDLYEVMISHLDDMARDIAEMQMLGPNPERQWAWLVNYARREAALEQAAGVEGAVGKAEGMVLEAEQMLAHYRGDLNMPVNPALAQAGGVTRGLLIARLLGSALLGEIGTGPTLGRLTRTFIGLDRNGDMGQLVRLLVDPAERAMARRTGFIIEQASDGFARASHDNLRLTSVGARAEDGLNALSRRLPAAVMRLQGLSGFVAARKRALRLELMGKLHDVRDRSLAEIAAGDKQDQALARWLDARGFTEGDWAVIRSSPTFTPRPGADFLLPLNVENRELGWRLAEAIDMETRLASPETTLESRALWVQQRPGTFWGEITRSTGMFKGFSATLSTLYAQEIALQAAARGGASGAGREAALMAAQAVIFLTIGGAVTMQLRELAKGNDPRPMNEAKFWGAAATQGGGLGIFGDFLYAAEARNGKSAALTAFGPVGELVADGWDLTGGNATEIAGGILDGEDLGDAVDDARVGRDAARVIRNYNPLASLWWTRAAWNRTVADAVQRGLDPEADEAFARQRRRMERDMGQGQWWETGSPLPSRAPDVGNIVGGGD